MSKSRDKKRNRRIKENSGQNQNSSFVYISVMNVIAAVSVVILHANVSFWLDRKTPYWETANIIESVFYFAVPVFFMLSGATLMEYQDRYSTKEFFIKRFKKTVIPFLAWSVVGLLWSSRKVLSAMLTGQPNGGLHWTFLSVTDGIINTKFRDIYWFFIPLFCIYLVMPLFASVRKEKREKIFTYIIGVSLVINFVIPFVLSLLNHYAHITFGWTYKIYVGYEYLFYVLVGYVIHKRNIKPEFRLIIYIVSLAALLVHMLGTFYATKANPNGTVVSLYKGYYNLPCVLYSIGVFLLVKQLAQRIKSKRVINVFTYLQGFTFPIYLIHRYFLDVFEENLKLFQMERASLLYVVLATVLALSLSILTTMLLRKIPVLRHIVP